MRNTTIKHRILATLLSASMVLQMVAPLAAPKVAPALIGGKGVAAATIVADGGAFDLVANNGGSTYPSFSNSTASAYDMQVTGTFPTGANITNKQIHIIAPVGLLIDTDGTNITQTTNQLVGGNAGITKPAADNWVAYAATRAQGRLYQVKTLADGTDLDTATVNLTLHRDAQVRAQTLTNAENHFKVIVSWMDNGVLNTDIVDVGGLTLTGADPVGGYSTFLLDSQSVGVYNSVGANNLVSSGKILPFQEVIYPYYTTSTVGTLMDSATAVITVTYTPVGGTPVPDTTHKLTLGSTTGAVSGWSLTDNGDGTYDIALNGTPKAAAGASLFALLDLTDPSLQNGDKITISYSGVDTHAYSGLVKTTTGTTQTYTIDNTYLIAIANVNVPNGIASDPSYGGVLYKGRITNTKGGTTPSQDVLVDFSGSNGITGVSPSLMYLPLQYNKVLTSIDYTLVDGTTGTLTGSWTGDKNGMVMLKMSDWQVAGLGDTSYLKSLSYTMGTIPGNYAVTWSAANNPPQGQFSFFGRWLDDSVKSSSIKVTLSNTDGSGTPVTQTLTDTLVTPNMAVYLSAGSTLIQDAGTRFNFSFNTAASYYNDGDGNGVMHSPVLYVRNESGGVLDMSSFKVTQLANNADITSQCTITDMGYINGAEVYKIDTAGVTSHGGQDAWIGWVPYWYDASGAETVVGKSFNLKVTYSIQTKTTTPNSPRYLNRNMFFLGHNDSPFTAMRESDGWSVAMTDPYGMTTPTATDLIAMSTSYTSNYYQIVGKTDLIPYFEAKPAGAPDTSYTNLERSSALPMSDTQNIDVRLSLINPSGVTVNNATVLIPIPKKGENWGAYSNNTAFPFTLNLMGPLSDPGNSTYNGFTIYYGTVATPSGNGVTIDSSTTWEAFNPAHAAAYNCIKVVADGLPYTDPGSGATPQEIQDANTWPLSASMSMPFDPTITDGTIDAWTPLYYENLTIPGTGPGTGPVSGWQAAGPKVGVQAMLGELTGQVYVDTDRNGVWDAGEQVVTPAAGWQFYLFKTANFNAAAFASAPTTWLADNLASAVGASATDASGRYFFDLLNRNQGYILVSVNATSSAYWYSPLGADMALSPIAIRSGTPAITTDPAAYGAVAAGVHVLATDGTWDGAGVSNVGLMSISYTVHYDSAGGTAVPDLDMLTYTSTGLTPATAPTKTGYDFAGWQATSGVLAGIPVSDATAYWQCALDELTLETTLVATWTPRSDTPYKVQHYWVYSSGAIQLHETESLTATTGATVTALAKDYSADHFAYTAGYPSEVATGTIAADGSLVLKLYYTQQTVHASVRYHKWSATGEEIATDPITGEFIIGDTIDPTLLLDAHKPYGFASGVAVGTWTVTADGMVFDVYYPDTPPEIQVQRPVIYVRKPATLTLADILRIAGVSITDAEETIPLDKLGVAGYEGIKWSVVNYPDGDGYTITLSVSDTPGLEAPVKQIAIFVEAADTPIIPTPGPVPPPPGKKWGRDPQGHLVLYIPTAPLALPQTGDGNLVYTTSALFVGAGLLVITTVLLRRRRYSS